jgi:hypothetical protein
MDSDVDVSRWVLELLLRDRDKGTIAKRVLPVHDWRLKKTVLLRTIESAVDRVWRGRVTIFRRIGGRGHG